LRRPLICLILAGALLCSGCESMRPNQGRLMAASWAAYAGRFRIAYGHWPTMSELEEFSCMRGRADRFGLELSSCDDVVKAPFRPQLVPRGANLELRFTNDVHQTVCRLTVLAPPAGAEKTMFPMIRIRTSIFGCRGKSKA